MGLEAFTVAEGDGCISPGTGLTLGVNELLLWLELGCHKDYLNAGVQTHGLVWWPRRC